MHICIYDCYFTGCGYRPLKTALKRVQNKNKNKINATLRIASYLCTTLSFISYTLSIISRITGYQLSVDS